MKKFLHIAALLLLAVSCEIPFDLDQAGEPRIYMQAIAKGAHVRIVPLVANPVGTIINTFGTQLKIPFLMPPATGLSRKGMRFRSRSVPVPLRR